MSQQVQYLFDATQHQPDAGQDPVPAGWYDVNIKNTSVEDIQGDKGWKFLVGYEITSGEYAGRVVTIGYNLGNKESAKNAEIAHKQLSAVSHVTGVFKLDMTNQGAELRGKALRINFSNDGTYNNQKAITDVHGNKPARAGGGAAPATTAPVASATPGQAWGAQPAAAPATPAGVTGSGWGTSAPATPPAAPAAPSAPAAPAPVVFPPEGWVAHPSAPGYFYKGQEVLTEAQLREKTAAPAAPTTPAAPPSAPAAWNQGGAPAATAPWGAQPGK